MIGNLVLTPFTAALLVASASILAAVGFWAVVGPWWRARRLAKVEPPTRAELEIVRELRRAGSFRLPGHSSSEARHFETSSEPVREGSRGCYEPALTTSWRGRTDR